MASKKRYHFDNAYRENPPKFGDLRLIQIGRRYCESGEIIDAHTHINWFELTIVTFGEGEISTNGKSSKVKAGDIYLSFPCDIHKIKASESSKFEFDFFSFFTESEKINNDLEKIMQNYPSSHSRVFQDEKIRYLVGCAISEFSFPKSDTDELLTNLFNSVIIYLIRNYTERGKSADNVSESEVLCYQMMNYIDTHIYSIQKLEEISAFFNYNYSYLSALFKNTTGKTLFEYYQNRRLEIAKVLILEKKKKIGEIAEMFNYASLFSFSRAFKANFGISPKALQLKKD